MKINQKIGLFSLSVWLVFPILANLACAGQEILTDTPSPNPQSTIIEADPTHTPEPRVLPTATPIPTPTPIRHTFVKDYGFSLQLDRDVSVQANGWTEKDPNNEQGIISFDYRGVKAFLSWYSSTSTPKQIVGRTYGQLRDGQPNLTFEPLREGEISISGEPGFFAGFRAIDDTNSSVGGGLIASWVCPESQLRYSITTTGPQATVVQLRFQRIIEKFNCSL